MASTNRWKLAKSKNQDEYSPPLFVKVTLSDTGYTVFLSDLCSVWTEKLEGAALLRRAENDASSINPAEDASQLRILLDKINGALHGVEGTSFMLDRSDSGKTLTVSLSAPLPPPLPALRWRLSLAKETSSVLTAELLCPLLLSFHRKQQAIDDLQAQIRDKDHVISRLLDRLESSGTDLTTVFPGTSSVKLSRKVGQRSQLAKYVKGLAPYEAHQWQTSRGHVPAIETLFDAVEDTEEGEALRHEFLSNLGLIRKAQPSSVTSKAQPSPSDKVADDPETTDDEDFQVIMVI